MSESRFDVPNDAAQDGAGQDQGQSNDDALASVSWLRTLSPTTTSEVALYGRWMRADVRSSPFDTPLAISTHHSRLHRRYTVPGGPDRFLEPVGARTRWEEAS